MIHTGVFIPGSSFPSSAVRALVGNQEPAINKGAYRSEANVKQRIVIVENSQARSNLIAALRNQQSYQSTNQADSRENASTVQKMVRLGNELSQEVITVAQYRSQLANGGYPLQKLYLQAQSAGLNTQAIEVSHPKTPPLEVASIAAAKTAVGTATVTAGVTSLVCGFMDCSLSSSIKIGIAVGGVLGFAAGTKVFCSALERQKLMPDFQTQPMLTGAIASKLIECGLHCKDIRILSDNSGDRSHPKDMTSANSRNLARTLPGNMMALDESLVLALNYDNSRRSFNRVSGYQGKCGFMDGTGHLSRCSSQVNEVGMVDEGTNIRQQKARVCSHVSKF